MVITTHPDSNANVTIQLILMEGDEQYLTSLDTIVIPPKLDNKALSCSRKKIAHRSGYRWNLGLYKCRCNRVPFPIH